MVRSKDEGHFHITDPVHGVVDFEESSSLVRQLIASPAFQRLRWISQLGLASFVFPGATHTRFSHGLGAAFLASKVMKHLNQNADKRNTVIAAALLHDVGHGPFSHLLERAIKPKQKVDNLPDHENWTATIILADETIRKALRKRGVDRHLLAAAFDKERRKKQSTLPLQYKHVVSSQLDVDRMDYLLRDSHYTGVAIGHSDIHYLINSMTLVRHGRLRSLGVLEKGVKAYEGFILARHLMNRTVYFHKAVRVFETMMEMLLRQTIRMVGDPKAPAAVVDACPRLFARLNRWIETRRFKNPQLTQTFMDKYLNEYLDLTEDRIWALVRVISEAREKGVPVSLKRLATGLLRRELCEHHRVESGKKSILEEALRDRFEDDTFAIVETASTPYRIDDAPVYVQLGSGRSEEVRARSALISAIHSRPEADCVLLVLEPKLASSISKAARDVGAIGS